MVIRIAKIIASADLIDWVLCIGFAIAVVVIIQL